MSTGEGVPVSDPTDENENTGLDWQLDHDDDDDEEEVDTTRPFQPGAASTPYQPPGADSTTYHGGEQHEMTHLGPEQSGMDENDPLIDSDELNNRF